jgi:hypothetical protein
VRSFCRTVAVSDSRSVAVDRSLIAMAAANGAHGASLGSSRPGGDCCSTANLSEFNETDVNPLARGLRVQGGHQLAGAASDGGWLAGHQPGPGREAAARRWQQSGRSTRWGTSGGLDASVAPGDGRDGEVDAVAVQAGADTVAVIGGCERRGGRDLGVSQWEAHSRRSEQQHHSHVSVLGNRSDGVLVAARPRRLQQTASGHESLRNRGLRVQGHLPETLRISGASFAVDSHMNASLRCEAYLQCLVSGSVPSMRDSGWEAEPVSFHCRHSSSVEPGSIPDNREGR